MRSVLANRFLPGIVGIAIACYLPDGTNITIPKRRGINMTKLAEIEGIGATYAAKLEAAGIASVEQLLEAGSTPNGRKGLADKTDISGKLILEWVNRADLFRISGIGEEYADLLEVAGVDTVPELAQRNPANLYKSLVEVNEEKDIVRRVPAESQVQSWVEQAKALPRIITY
jgi:predicted flap endonuclease-1-like 5' DNA nuclease